jgi:Ser/Thr protein kinase RdoA (MazF antagonist)
VTLALGERLGSGGTSDVYALDDGSGCVLKSARVATAAAAAGFDAEVSALSALRHAAADALVPALVASGERLPDAAHALAGAALGAARWCVLLLRPRGEPLERWVSACVARAEAAAGQRGGRAAAAAARRKCADDVALRVLAALLAAHEAGWAHCDVRPANVAVVEDRAMLIDWGSARRVGDGLLRSGVEAFTDARVWSDRGVDARPHHDALAALYTWLAVAFGDDGAAPWLDICDKPAPDESVDFVRSAWVAALAQRDEGVKHVALAIEKLEKMTGNASPAAAVAVALAGLGH